MANLLRFEGYKLLHNRTFWVLLIALFGAAVLYPIMVYTDQPTDGSGLNGSQGIDLFVTALAGNEYVIKIGLCILAGFFISSEYANGTMKRSVSAGTGRSRVILAKLLVLIGGSALVSLVFPVVNLAIGSLLLGFGHVPFSVPLWEYLLRTLGSTVLLAASYAVLSGVFATVLTDSGRTIGIGFVFYFFVDYLFLLASKYMPFMDDVYQASMFRMIQQVANGDMMDMNPLRIAAIPVLSAIVFLLASAAVFRRKEIK